MIGAAQHSKNKKIPTITKVTCPACNKNRLGKYVNDDGSVDPVLIETVEVRETTRYLEVCDFCINRYRKEDERYVMDNYRKMVEALNSAEAEDAEDKQTDHKDFSLN